MDLSQASWQGSCASRTHTCLTLSVFPRHGHTEGSRLGGISMGHVHHRVSCVMDLSRTSWQGSCASWTHKCRTLSIFPRHGHVPHPGCHYSRSLGGISMGHVHVYLVSRIAIVDRDL